MKRNAIRLLLACLLLSGILSACSIENAADMTAVPIGTKEATEKASDALTPDAATVGERNTTPSQTNTVATVAPTQAAPSDGPPQPTVTESLPPETEVKTQPENERRELAKLCINSDVSVLFALIGEPPYGSSYTARSSGSGEDGTLNYDGFTVYTYRDNGTEIVVGVS